MKKSRQKYIYIDDNINILYILKYHEKKQDTILFPEKKYYAMQQ